MNQLENSWAGYLSLVAFVVAYALIIFEAKIHLRKSKPVVFIGCLIWIFIAIFERSNGTVHAEEHIRRLIGEIGELFFFLVVAMTYINTLQERLVFDSLRAWLIRRGFGYRTLFWVTGIITFFLSSVADNLTSALVIATVVHAVGGTNKRFIVPAFINVIVASNAGGAWTPIGDITSIMVWTAGKVGSLQFLSLFIPSIISWLIPAAIMSPFIPKNKPEGRNEIINMKPGAKRIIFLGFATITLAISLHQFLQIPPVIGMMMGLALLMFMGFHLKKQDKAMNVPQDSQFNIFGEMERVEFDTLLFFFGIMSAIGGLSYIGYLTTLSHFLYGVMGPTFSNTAIGVMSAVIDNIPLMYGVIQMNPPMGIDQWLLVTFAAGTGGSMLSIGSAAGVAVMGIRRDLYTFKEHLKWTPAIALGYFAGIGCWWLITHW